MPGGLILPAALMPAVGTAALFSNVSGFNKQSLAPAAAISTGSDNTFAVSGCDKFY